MRLTLRTLLAYLDDVLDPVDKEELSQKIESSEFAEDLVHRTRDTVRRLRLSAPQVIGTGMGLDPNTVAEYLDNVMPPEQVGDFERICLESDVHLAEATACHHVLTMVLGEPADVDPISRQRMYTISTEAGERKRLRVEPAHTAMSAAATAVAAPLQPVATPASHAPQPHTTEIPEYLRAGSWWRSTNAVIALAAIVLVGTAIVFVTGARDWFGGKPGLAPLTVDSSAPPLDAVASNNNPATEPPAGGSPGETDNSFANSPPLQPLGSPPPPMTPGITPQPNQTAAAAPPNGASNGNPYSVVSDGTPAATAPPNATDVATAPPTSPAQSPDTTSMPPVPPENTQASAAAASVPATPLLPPPSAPATGAGMPLANATTAIPPDAATATPPTASVAIATPPIPASLPDAAPPQRPAAPAAPPDSGTYMGGKTVLLWHNDQTNAWFRVEPRSAIVPGMRVLSLPEFRPRIALVSGLQLDLTGGSQAILGLGNDVPPTADPPAAADFIPALELVYGRVVLVNPTNADKQIRLQLGPNSGLATIGRNKTLGIELERKHVPGQDPRQTPAPLETRLYAPDGGVVWHDAAGDKNIEKPSRWAIVEGASTDIADDPAPPEWIDHEPVVQLSEQRYGAPEIENTLVSNAPADTQLSELFHSSKRKEVKSLVARSAIHVGLFQPFIEALRDSEQKANWKMHIDTLRGAMALSPDSANNVFQSLVDQRGKPAAADLYEMLCGYTPDQIGHTPDQMKAGAVVKLINWLEDDSLDYRVLAAQDLYEATAKRLMPNPAANLAERTKNIKTWRARLDAGDLKPAAAPQ